MFVEYDLDVNAEMEYAEKWAFRRNPAYYNFENIGGDCTNFVSQCLYAGGAVMDHTRDTGWYYVSPDDRAAAWTSVEYLYKFLIRNKGIGPFGEIIPLYDVRQGDIIQLGSGEKFYHTLLVIGVKDGVPHIAAHTYDAYDVPIFSYGFGKTRCIRIIGARK